MLDHLIKGGTVVDGTGRPAVIADVGVRDGRIVAVGEVDEPARETMDADGMLVTPGFIDPHTHYDAQLHWDPGATPSNVHGVTSVISGNCGFTLAPLRSEEDADYLRRMMMKVEGMPLAALEQGVDWDWHTFGDFLDRLDSKIAVNAGFLVGHCAIRRYVMGPDSVGNEATPEQIEAMAKLLGESLEAGGLGFSTTLSRTHSDGDGQPVPSRWSSPDELVALCRVVEQHAGTTLEGMTDGCLDRFEDKEIELFIAMSAAARRPINWNVLTVDSREAGRVPHQLAADDRAQQAGARIVALTMPVLVPMNMSFLNHCGLFLIPGWSDVLGLPVPERMEELRKPEVRQRMLEQSQAPEAGVFKRLADFPNYIIGDTYSAANEGLKERRVADIAAERGAEPFSTLVDIVLADDLRTILWPIPPDGDDASWKLRQQVWADDRAMIGGSDAGAHLDRMCGAPYTTRFLGDTLRGRKLVSVERAVQLMTDAPAKLFGIRDRGRVAEGGHADLVVIDPDSVGAEHATLVHDLPGNTARLTAASHGVARVFVNGTLTVVDGEATGALPGTILRSGRDTDTVSTV
jgi:N-acyl-D-aspartate/D-glutamate deacylase